MWPQELPEEATSGTESHPANPAAQHVHIAAGSVCVHKRARTRSRRPLRAVDGGDRKIGTYPCSPPQSTCCGECTRAGRPRERRRERRAAHFCLVSSYSHTETRTLTNTHTHTYTHTNTHTHTHAPIHIPRRLHINIRIHMHMHIHIRTHTHAHTHIHSHAHTTAWLLCLSALHTLMCVGITIFTRSSRLSLCGHTGVLGSGRSPLEQARGAGQGCVPVAPLDQCMCMCMCMRLSVGYLVRLQTTKSCATRRLSCDSGAWRTANTYTYTHTHTWGGGGCQGIILPPLKPPKLKVWPPFLAAKFPQQKCHCRQTYTFKRTHTYTYTYTYTYTCTSVCVGGWLGGFPRGPAWACVYRCVCVYVYAHVCVRARARVRMCMCSVRVRVVHVT